MKIFATSLFLITGFFFLIHSPKATAAALPSAGVGVQSVGALPSDSLNTESDEGHGSIFPEKSRSLAFSHFTWGAELGSSIDMTGHDMSTLDADVVLGYKNKWIRTLGVGAGIHRAFGTGDNFIPVYAVFRTSFTSRPSNFFMNMKLGYSFNSFHDSPIFGDTSASLGAGINLAMSRTFQSHIILSVSHRHFSKRHWVKHNLDEENIFLVSLCFGVNF